MLLNRGRSATRDQFIDLSNILIYGAFLQGNQNPPLICQGGRQYMSLSKPLFDIFPQKLLKFTNTVKVVRVVFSYFSRILTFPKSFN